jgi:GDPmannose 4,6-dehydratase
MMWLMLQQETPDDYVAATGETHSVREFVEAACACLDIPLAWVGSGVDEVGIRTDTNTPIVRIDPNYFRPTEVDLLVGDATKAKTQLGWEHSVSFKELVSIMATADWALVTNNEQVYY